ncbi:MAG TPA: carbohydrate ABC transporter permease [Lachnospiraceae bacterium]|jgi:multiple sugar transport system permease protein|nr:carbohydrate ABC transporter permease [Lachnospiraceae bacterium]
MSTVSVNYTEDKRAKDITKVVRTIICVFLCILSIFPFYMLIVNATLTHEQVLKCRTFYPKGMISGFIRNFKGLNKWCKDAQTIPIGKAMLNSLIVTVPTTILQVYFASLTAYGIVVYNFKFKKAAWGFIYAIMMIPTQVSIIGFIALCRKLHMMGTWWPLILPAMAAPTTVYFMKQYMEAGFSVEIVEAARIDGANEFYIFNAIALPLLKPAMATQAIFGFVACWNNLYVPSLILATNKKTLGTLPMFIEMVKSNDKQRNWGYIYSGIFTAVMPILIAYLFLSKYIVAGVALGGVKE